MRRIQSTCKTVKKRKSPIQRSAAVDLPCGWTEEVYERGGSEKTTYKYWYSPIMKYKFRAKKSAQLFIDALSKSGDDEMKAFDIVKESLR